MRNWNHVCQNVPVDTATFWAGQVIKFCNGGLQDSGAIFVKQDNIKQEVVHRDMQEIKDEDLGIKMEVKEELVVKEEIAEDLSLDNLRSLDALSLDFVKKEPGAEVQIKKEPGSKKGPQGMRKSGKEKEPQNTEQSIIKKESEVAAKIKDEKAGRVKVEPRKGKQVLKQPRPQNKNNHYGGDENSQNFAGVFEQAKHIEQANLNEQVNNAEQVKSSKKLNSLWEASGELEMPKRTTQVRMDAEMAAKLQLEERRRSSRLVDKMTSLSTINNSGVTKKKMGLSEACVVLPMSQLSPVQLEQLKLKPKQVEQLKLPLSQACQTRQEDIATTTTPMVKKETKEEKKPDQGKKGKWKEKLLVQTSVADLTDIGTEVEVNTEAHLENKEKKKEGVKEQKENGAEKNSQNITKITGKRKLSAEKVNACSNNLKISKALSFDIVTTR